MDKIFSISEAADYLGVFPLTLRNWEKKGMIKAFRTMGGHRRFKKVDLDRIRGIEAVNDMLEDVIGRLEGVGFKNGRQKKLNNAIRDLKTISEEPCSKTKIRN